MPTPYYGGKSAYDGKQFALEAHTFKECVERYVNVPIVLRVSRSEFWNLDKPSRSQFKDGPFLTACTFREGTSERNDENAGVIKLAFLDFDTPTESELAQGFVDYASDFAEDFAALHEALAPWNYVVGFTASSTKEHPRFRIMVEVADLPKRDYAKIIRAIARALGVICEKWAGFKESKVVSQPMYRFAQFQGEEYTAVIRTRTSGVAFDDLDIPVDIDDTVAEVTDLSYDGDEGFTATSLAHLPVAGLSPEEVKPALNAIDPDVTYMTWFKVLTALKHQFRGEQANEAYEMFDEWSAKGSKYKGFDEIAAKWRSAKPETTGRVPVTIRSLFKLAIESGWDSSKLSERFREDLEGWMVSASTDSLMNEGPERIAAMPFANGIVEEGLVLRLKEAIKAGGGSAIDKRTIMKAVRSERRKSLSETKEKNKPEWLVPWVFISPENAFRHTGHGLQLSVPAFNNTYSKELLKGDEDGIGKPSMLPTDYALNILDLKRVEGVVYDPRNSEKGVVETFKTFQGRQCFNEFLPDSVPAPSPRGAKRAMKIFKRFLRTLTGEEEYARIVLDYLAWGVQRPGEKVRWIPFIQSGQGAGKSLMCDVMQVVHGLANIKLVEPGSLKSDFNDWAVGCTFLCIEEMFVPGADRMKVFNSIKTLITNDLISVRMKGESTRVMLNTANIVAFTNFHTALFIEESDRRYMIIESPLQSKEDMARVKASGLFDDMVKIKEKMGPALRHALLHHKIAEDFPVNGPAPMTKFREANVFTSKPEVLLAIEDALEDEDIPTISEDLIVMKRLTQVLGPIGEGKKLAIQLAQLGYKVYEGGRRFSFGNRERTTLWVKEDKFDFDLETPEEAAQDRLTEEVGSHFD
jgi:hypothetical protein